MKILMLNIHLGTLQLKRPANIGVIECIEISNLLRKAGHQVDMGSIRDTDVAIDYDKLDVNSYDKILLMNGPVDFPGGAPSSYHQKLFEFLAKSDKSKDIYYILVDLALPFVQMYPKVMNRAWNPYKSIDEIRIANPITIISQSNNFDEVRRIHQKSDMNLKDIKYVPINEWIYFTEDVRENSGTVDLILGTSNRGGRRMKKYLDYFYGRPDLKIELYGKIQDKHFPESKTEGKAKPIFSGPLKDARGVVAKNSTGFATVVTGDTNYYGNIVTLRVAESILANCITFIDQEYDPNHSIFPNIPYLYINNGDELEYKIKQLRANPEAAESIRVEQRKLIEKCKANPMIDKFIEALN